MKKKTNLEQANAPTASTTVPKIDPQGPPIDLAKPLRWKSATLREQKMLRNLQGNILKGHGRDHTWNIFFELGTDQLVSRRALREIGNFYVTDAYKQLLETEAFKEEGKEGGTFCAAFLSHAGYAALGLTFNAPPANNCFAGGMTSQSSLQDLADPLVADWEAPFQESLHGMILIADDNTDRGSAAVGSVQGVLLAAGAKIHHIQPGKAIRNSAGNGLEHFGYVDGRSQPLVLVEDIEKESRDEGLAHWNAAFPLEAALVRDPLIPTPSSGNADEEDPEAFGSFFIFRKLEQKVADFKIAEQKLATTLNLTGDDRELAGALVVGRFEDGTPVTMASSAKGRKNPANDFDYSADTNGARCPFHAHIRKTNPRGSGGFEEEGPERAHIMPRRGIPYEDRPRLIHPDSLPEASTEEEFTEKVLPLLPADGVGLLFMAYNSRLDDQFVFTQKLWANNANFPNRPTPSGIDGVIGQLPPGADPDVLTGQKYPKQWDDIGKGEETNVDFKGFVRMKGGEYFFAPSVLFLRGL